MRGNIRHFVTNAVTLIDAAAWFLALVFFCGSALIFGGDVRFAFIGASGVIVLMFLIGVSIEIIIESIKNAPGIGTIVGFITNGPEMLCLIVGLAAGNVLFAASTPLGSNLMNPLLLLVAVLIVGSFGDMRRRHHSWALYFCVAIGGTAALAVVFFWLGAEMYPAWIVVALLITGIVFYLRPEDRATTVEDVCIPGWFRLPAIGVLILSGYFLEPVVSFASEYSRAPLGVIGFVVLAFLTSWPEFKSTLGLLNRGKTTSAILNIIVSNVTNIWLAVAGVTWYLLWP